MTVDEAVPAADTGATPAADRPWWRVPGPWRPIALAVVCWIASFALAGLIFPQLPAMSRGAATMVAATVMTCLALAWVVAATTLQAHRTFYLTIGGVGLVAVLLAAGPEVARVRAGNQIARHGATVTLLTAAQAGLPLTQPLVEPVLSARNAVYRALMTDFDTLRPEPEWPSWLWLSLGQLLLATGIGLWIGVGIDDIGYLIPISVVAGLADLWSVFGGATHLLVRSAEINYFLLRFPEPGSARVPMLIGLSDFIFASIYYASATRFGLDRKRNLILLLVSFLLSVGVAVGTQHGIPVLPVMAMLFVAGNWRHLSVSRRDLATLLYVLAGMALVFALFSSLMR